MTDDCAELLGILSNSFLFFYTLSPILIHNINSYCGDDVAFLLLNKEALFSLLAGPSPAAVLAAVASSTRIVSAADAHVLPAIRRRKAGNMKLQIKGLTRIASVDGDAK